MPELTSLQAQISILNQSLTTGLATHTAQIEAAQNDADDAQVAANSALTQIYQTGLDSQSYTQEHIQLLRDELTALITASGYGVLSQANAQLLDSLSDLNPTLQAELSAAVAAVQATASELNIDLTDMTNVTEEMLNVTFPALNALISDVEAQANSAQTQIETAMAGLGFTTIVESLDGVLSETVGYLQPLKTSVLRLPAALWTIEPDSASFSPKLPPAVEDFITNDPILGEGYAFPAGEVSIGWSYPSAFDPTQIYRIGARFRVTDNGSGPNVDLAFRASTWNAGVAVELGVAAPTLTHEESDGEVAAYCYATADSTSLALLADLNLPVLDLSGSTTAQSVFFSVQQNVAGATYGRVLLASLEVQDVSFALRAMSELMTPTYSTVAEMLADTSLSYSGATPVSAGDIATADGFRYRVAASGATDHQLVAAGGAKLYVLPASSGRYNVKAFGAVGDGSADDSAALQTAVNVGKATPGITIYFPKGAYKIVTSIDCTYAGVAAALSTGYYGFQIEGSDWHNTYLMGNTTGTPTFDCTGKPRMTFRNIGFANYTDGAHNPSCLLLLARNTTNSYAGGHLLERVSFRGYVTQTMLQTASSEVNKFIAVEWEPYKNSTSGLELTEQIETTVNSSYIDLSAHTFSGGNTRQLFVGCAFNSSVLTSGSHAVRMSEVQSAEFLGCYSHGKGTTAFLLEGTNTAIDFIDHRDESGSTYAIQLASGSVSENISISGRFARALRAEDTATIARAKINTNFWATTTTYSLDAYDLTDSDLQGLTNGARVRNSARGTVFKDYRAAGAWSFPTGDLTQPQSYGLSYSGGSSNYRRRIETSSIWERRSIGRHEVRSLVLPNTHIADMNATNYPSGYTPDLNVSSHFSFVVTGSCTINAPASPDLGPGDTKGHILILTFSQNGTGGYTVTLPSNYDLQGATIPTSAYARICMMFTYVETSGGMKWMRIN